MRCKGETLQRIQDLGLQWGFGSATSRIARKTQSIHYHLITLTAYCKPFKIVITQQFLE